MLPDFLIKPSYKKENKVIEEFQYVQLEIPEMEIATKELQKDEHERGLLIIELF